MNGGSQSRLMIGADRMLWVVKFQNNPQHQKVLANEMIVTGVAEEFKLPVPKCSVIEVTSRLIASDPQMVCHGNSRHSTLYTPGRQYGSQYVGGLMPRLVMNGLVDSELKHVRNLEAFLGMLTVDKWTGNCDQRQAVFERKPNEKRYRAIFVDHGNCFNTGAWSFPDKTMQGVYRSDRVYESVIGWDSFEPWLEGIKEFSPEILLKVCLNVPPEWYGDNWQSVERLIEQLLARRRKVPELIHQFRNSNRMPFPNWRPSVFVSPFCDWLQSP
jgi:hypothetical protein